jgi:hypothetical protein
MIALAVFGATFSSLATVISFLPVRKYQQPAQINYGGSYA